MGTAPAPYIPQFITVHLGPPDSNAQNVIVSFPNYVKNVASSEIYPTWPENALIANIYAIISYALNRIYLEWYRSRGYNFDITNSTAYDQAYNHGRNIFENISRIVDNIYTTYIRRQGNLEPFPAQFCNGTTVTCDGLSQWGSVSLANQGYTPYNILTYYYGDDIDLVRNAPISGIRQSYPGTPLRVGSSGNAVRTIQVELNRISQNYPLIPKINPVDGIFGVQTENAVRTFQQIFNLAPDGIVGEATWNRLVSMYVGIKRLTELESEGQSIFGISLEYPDAISQGDEGEKVYLLQYFINLMAEFIDTIPFVGEDGIFGPETYQAVVAFQRRADLPQTGVVDDATWNLMVDAVRGIVNTTMPINVWANTQTRPFGGTNLQIGSRGEDVRVLQQYLNYIALTYRNIPLTVATGVYSARTRDAVSAFQREFGLPVTGVTDRATWDAIASVYSDLLSKATVHPEQFPGYTLEEGMNDVDLNAAATPR